MNFCGCFVAVDEFRDVLEGGTIGLVQDITGRSERDGGNIDVSATLLNSLAELTHKMDCIVSHLK
jgi:hypothetical protein